MTRCNLVNLRPKITDGLVWNSTCYILNKRTRSEKTSAWKRVLCLVAPGSPSNIQSTSCYRFLLLLAPMESLYADCENKKDNPSPFATRNQLQSRLNFQNQTELGVFYLEAPEWTRKFLQYSTMEFIGVHKQTTCWCFVVVKPFEIFVVFCSWPFYLDGRHAISPRFFSPLQVRPVREQSNCFRTHFEEASTNYCGWVWQWTPSNQKVEWVFLPNCSTTQVKKKVLVFK